MSIKIDKNIPIPRKRSGRPRKYPNFRVILREMEIGDSIEFSVDSEYRGQLKSAAAKQMCRAAAAEGFKTAQRVSKDRKTLRVWRTA